MSGNSQQTLTDDFYKRLSKIFRPKFIENVDNPTLLVDHLQCLEKIDEETVRAQQVQYGAIHAASVLYSRLTRRDDWIEDVTRALRDKRVNLDFLADELEKLTQTVSARWDIVRFEDKDGFACFNGNCTKIDDGHVNVVPNLIEKKNAKADVKKASDSPDSSETVSSEKENKMSTKTKEDETISWEIIYLRRENLRLKWMEKVLSTVEDPKDLPIALDYLKQINVQILRIDHGSVLLSFYIGSLEALHTFEQLWRFGGLKKLLDKEMLDDSMLKKMQAIASEAGHPVQHIQSGLEISECDLERCRSALIRKSFDVRPMDFAEALLVMTEERDSKTMTNQVLVKYLTDRLPGELHTVMEDPFVSERIGHFYESCKNIIEQDESTHEIRSVSVSQYFADWLNEELLGYLKGLDDSTTIYMLSLAIYVVQKVDSGGTSTIPCDTTSENFSAEKIEAHLQSDTYNKKFWFDRLRLSEEELTVDSETVQKACNELSEKRLMCKSKKELKFTSTLVRDIFITKVVLSCRLKGSLKTITACFEYVQTLIGMYKTKLQQYVSHETEATLDECAFKTAELREIGISGEGDYEAGTESSFYNQDLIYSRDNAIRPSKELSCAGTLIKNNLAINEKRKHILADLSESLDARSTDIKTALHWLNITPLNFRNSTRGLHVNIRSIDGQELESIGLYLNATATNIHLSLRNCQLEESILKDVLQSGYFRNIRHLNISENSLMQKSQQPLGLKYIPSLEKLEIQNCGLGDDAIKILATDLIHTNKLRELNVADNNISPVGLLCLSRAMATNKRLTSLRIHKNYFGEQGNWILASWLESLILLEVLNISECGIGDKGSHVIAKALVSRSLRKLSMRKNELTPKGSRLFFETFRRPPFFEHFDFSENTLFTHSGRYTPTLAEDLPPSGKGEPFEEFLQHPTPMSHLSLWKTSIGKKRLFQSLQAFKCFEEMTYLCLQDNNISDDFTKDLAACIGRSRCSQLEHINLRQNHIGSNGATAIAKVLSTQRHLKVVLLDRNEVGDDGANDIVVSCAGLPFIEKIDLSCNSISKRTLNSILDDFEEKVESTETDIKSFSSQFTFEKISLKGDTFNEGTERRLATLGIQSPVDDSTLIIERKGHKYVIIIGA